MVRSAPTLMTRPRRDRATELPRKRRPKAPCGFSTRNTGTGGLPRATPVKASWNCRTVEQRLRKAIVGVAAGEPVAIVARVFGAE
jgi:hypothetical protein